MPLLMMRERNSSDDASILCGAFSLSAAPGRCLHQPMLYTFAEPET